MTRRVDAEIDLLPSAKPLKHGARVRLHNGTAEVLGRVSIAGASIGEIAPGATALVRVRLESPAVLTRGDRFIIRAYSPPMTIGGGVVLDPGADPAGHPLRRGPREPRALANGRRRRRRHPVAMIDSAGLAGIASRVACLAHGRAAVTPRDGGADGSRRHGVVVVDDRLVDASASAARAGRAASSLVTASHKANPMSDGLPREEARGKVFAQVAPAIFETRGRRSEGGAACWSAPSAWRCRRTRRASRAPTIRFARRSSRRIAPAA